MKKGEKKKKLKGAPKKAKPEKNQIDHIDHEDDHDDDHHNDDENDNHEDEHQENQENNQNAAPKKNTKTTKKGGKKKLKAAPKKPQTNNKLLEQHEDDEDDDDEDLHHSHEDENQHNLDILEDLSSQKQNEKSQEKLDDIIKNDNDNNNKKESKNSLLVSQERQNVRHESHMSKASVNSATGFLGVPGSSEKQQRLGSASSKKSARSRKSNQFNLQNDTDKYPEIKQFDLGDEKKSDFPEFSKNNDQIKEKKTPSKSPTKNKEASKKEKEKSKKNSVLTKSPLKDNKKKASVQLRQGKKNTIQPQQPKNDTQQAPDTQETQPPTLRKEMTVNTSQLNQNTMYQNQLQSQYVTPQQQQMVPISEGKLESESQIQSEFDIKEEEAGLKTKEVVVKPPREKYNYNVKFKTLGGVAVCCRNIARLCILTGKKLKRCTNRINKKCDIVQKKTKNKFRITSQFILISSLFFVSWIFYVVFTSDSSSITEADGFHKAKRYTANRLISGSLIFTLYGIMMMQIEKYIYLYLLFIFQAMPALFIFLYYGYSAFVQDDIDIYNRGFIDSAFVFGIYIFWLTTWLLKEDLKNFVSRKARNLFLTIWCVFVGAIITGYTVYLTCTTLELNFAWGHQLLTVIAGPYIAMLCLIWVYLHFRFFHPLIIKDKHVDPKEVKIAIENLKEQQAIERQLQIDINQVQANPLDNEHESDRHMIDIDKVPLQLNPSDKDFENKNKELNDLNDVQIDLIGGGDQDMDGNQEGQKEEEIEKVLSPQEQYEARLLRRKRNFQNYLVIFTSCTLGGSMLFLTILSTLYVAHHTSLGEVKNYENPQAFFLSLFMIVFVPAFIIISTGVIFAKVSEKLKLILIPIFGAMIPLLFSVPLSLVIDYFVETRPLRTYFALGPAGVCIWMITLIYIRIDKWKLSMLLNSYICLFFVVPFIYILPLKSNDIWESDDDDEKIGDVTYFGLLIAGVGLIFLVFAIDLIVQVVKTWIQHKNRHKKKQDGEIEQVNEFVSNQRFELSNVFRYDLEFFGLWGNAFGYILTFTILIYMYYNSPEWITDPQSGNLVGLQVTICVLFFWCLIILMMRIISEKKKESVSFSEQITSMMSSTHEKAILIDRQRKVRWSIVRFTLLENTVFCLVMMAIFWDNEELRWSFITMMFGIYVVGLIFCQLYVTKRNFDDFSKTAIPALVTFSWIFLYLPFSGIIPTSIMYLSEQDESLVLYERLVIGGTALLLLTGVVLLGLLIHLYFRRKEFERKFKFVASKVIKKLAKAHVKSDYSSLNLAFQGYVSKEREEAIKSMCEGKPCYFTEISKYNPDLRFSIMIIDHQTHVKLTNPKKPGETKLEKFLYYFMKYYCCYRLCEKKSKNQIRDEENANLLDQEGNGDGDDDIQGMMDKAHAANVKQMEEDDLIVDEDPWMKKYLINQDHSGFYGDIIEALRRYDLPQNLQISKPWQSQFIKHIFAIFAQGSKRKFDMPWIDYTMFKQLIVLSHISPSREFPDHFIDKMYGKFTNYERMANQNPITEGRFTGILTKIAIIKYPYDPEEHALGKLVKFWLFPYLLWFLKPLHGLYPHEWDYVLFLLKFYDHKDNHDNTISNDVNFRRDLEKYLGIGGDKDKFLEDDGSKGKQKWTWKRFMDWLKEWCRMFCNNWLYFIKSHCLLDRDMQEQEVDEIEVEVKMVNNTILKPVPFANKRKKVFKHDQSPEWPKVVEIMFDEMKEAEENYKKMKDAEFAHVKIRFRITNITCLIFKFIEIFALGSLAFTPNVDWGIPVGIQDILNFFNTLSPSITYGVKYVVSFIAMLVYLFAMYRSVIRIRHHEFGSSESNRKKKKIFTFDFVLSLTVNFISMVMSLFMLKIFFDAFSCDYSVKPQTMYQDLEQECQKGTHLTYYGLSIIGLLIFYPEITYLWPNVQYQNKSLDPKYDPTHQCIAQNAKVLIACTCAFFAHPDDTVYMMGCCAFILFGMGTLTRKMKPCMVKIINPLEMGGYFAAGWMHISGIICRYTNATGGWISLGCGLFIIIIISLGFWKILLDLQKDAKRKKKIKQINEETGEEEEIEVEINSDDEEEEEERRRKQQKEESLEFRVWKATNEFKDVKIEKDEWLDENLIPYKDDELEVGEEEEQGEELKDGELEQQKDGDQQGEQINDSNKTNDNTNNINNNNNDDEIKSQSQKSDRPIKNA